MRPAPVLAVAVVLGLCALPARAQLSGNYTLDPNGSGPRNYTTFAGASAALAAGVSGPVVFQVAPVTFSEWVSFNAVPGASATNTIRFVATGAPAVIRAGTSIALALNSCAFFVFENLEFDCSGTYCLNSSQANDNTFRHCKFSGGGQVVYSQGMNRCVFDACELDGKGTASRLVSPYNANDSDCLFENCFIHDCSPTGLGVYLNVSGYGILFWHNTVLVKTTQNAVHLGGCCAWSRANSFRNNIVVNTGTGVCIKYGASAAGVLEYNDADYNCYFAPSGNACELENGSAFTRGTLAQWQAYFNTNRATMVPQTGAAPIPTPAQARWDDNSIEMDPLLVGLTAPYDIHLQGASPCLNAGTTTYVAGPWISYRASYVVTDDFEDDPRPATGVDIGADETAVQLVGSGAGKPGTTIAFTLIAAADTGLPYQLGSSLGSGPLLIDTRRLDLSLDQLLVVSVSGLLPGVFQDYAGVLDPSGQAAAKLHIPNAPVLTGLRIHTAFVTLRASAPSGIASLSGTFLFTVQ
ncbi:MAG: right-handed parallel beta-helix repeat-containing protein [Planctomycetes bacterium]|nr:right-handed parallel beta-helix repeat-containing protein [Planctomycetota bacterium]